MKYELYGMIHKAVKKFLKKNNDLPDTMKLVNFPEEKIKGQEFVVKKGDFINETTVINNRVHKSQVYPIENLVRSEFDAKYPVSFQKNKRTRAFASNLYTAKNLWSKFLESSVIQNGYRNAGMHYAGYIYECQEWCLPSWVWTNAAMVRYYCSIGEVEKAQKLGDLILEQQQPCGGWIVRNDYTHDGVSPQMAPNDSCYIGLNCCIELYKATNKNDYLDSAKKVAAWVMDTARIDGMVWFSYDTKRNVWIKDKNIVDTGFTAGLFAALYEITHDEKYIVFLRTFIWIYIKLFYMPKNKCFATAIDRNDLQYGGAFGRGQGWALEGLIPAYRVLKDEKIKSVIDATVETLLNKQLKNGGWSYNLLKPLMGEDCKAVPVIAKCLLEWYKVEMKDERLLGSAGRALQWCVNHTALTGAAAGGVFSYTIEGAVVHNMYTNTAFVYGSSYALELQKQLDDLARGKR